MTAALMVVATVLLVAGVPLCLPGRTRGLGIGAQVAGCALLAVTGSIVFLTGHAVGAGFTDEFSPCLGVDGLSGLFLATLGVVGVPALTFSAGYLGERRRDGVVAALTGMFVLAMVALLCARDPITLLASWELMTLLPAAIILVHRGADREARQTAFVYLAITHLGGVGTWVAILLLAHAGAMGSSGAVASGSGLQIGIALAALVGMGTKAGLVPMHSWLPRAHPIAPAPVSALMSGVMIKLAVYAMTRVFVDWLGVLPVWFGVLVLGLGALSAVGGITYALFQRELKRILALSSIENVGIVVVGLGACLLLRTRGDDVWAGLALGAALLHTINHAMFKSLAFLAAGSIERAAGTLDVDRLGGLLRRMPWTGAALAVGCLSIAGLPPINGFVSEWLTVQAVLHLAMTGRGDGLYGAVALAALAATAALAVFCFVRVTGLVLLGPPRRPRVDEAVEVTASMRYPVIYLAAGCVLLGLAPGLLVGRLAALAPWPVGAPSSLYLTVPGTGSLPTPVVAVFLVVATISLVRLRGARKADPAPTWVCGQPVGAQLQWSSAGFTKPLQLVLSPLLRTRREVEVESEHGQVTGIAYHGEVPNLIDEKVYRPAMRGALILAAQIRRLQSGSVATYAAYLVGLLVVALAATRLGWFM